MLSKYISNGGAKIHIEKIVEDKEGNACRRESENMLEEDDKVRLRGWWREGRGRDKITILQTTKKIMGREDQNRGMKNIGPKSECI